MNKYIASIIALLSASFVNAGVVYNAKVNAIRVDASGLAMVVVNTNSSNTAGCVSQSYLNAFSFNTNTTGGKSILSTALAAKATSSTISIVGSNLCSEWPGVVESINFAVMGK